MKKIAVGNLGEEELAQLKMKLTKRVRDRMEAEALFEHGGNIRDADRALVEKLFVQANVAETLAPNLQKTAAVDAFFDKVAQANLTDAQRRYPELLKVSAAPGVATRPTPTLGRKTPTTSTTGPVAVKSNLSGGAA